MLHYPILPEVLLYEQQPFCWEGMSFTSGGFGAGSYVDEIQMAQLNDNRQVLVRAVVYNTSALSTEAALIRYDLDTAGSVLIEDVLIKEPDIPVGQTVGLNSLVTGETHAEINNAGDFIWCGDLDNAAGTQDGIIYHTLNTIVWQSDTPSVIAGRNWSTGSSAPVTLNNAGDWAALLHLDNSVLADQALISVNGNVVLQEGDPLPYSPVETITTFSYLPVDLSDTGVICYYANWGTLGSSDEGIFCGDEPVCLSGVTQTTTGETVTLIGQYAEAFRMSDGGEYVMFFAFLDNGTQGLLLSQKNIGSPYCSATTNSTGQAATTSAFGSTNVSLNSFFLRASGLPANEFGVFLTSQTQDFVAFPGNSVGHLCLGGTIGRFMGQIQNSGANGVITISADLTNFPVGGGTQVQAGDTWYKQAWYRDIAGGGSNFSLPIAVTFD